jgi:Zn-dependent protease
MRATIRLGRVRGIEIGVHWSLLVIGFLIASTLAGSLLPDLEPHAGGSYWAAAILATILFFGSILAHELAHALVAIRRGQRVEGITLWLLGGVATLRDEARDARSEFLVAIAGPVTSIALGGLFLAAGVGLDAALASGSLLPAVCVYLGVINLILAAFNLLPGAPLDGGRVLTAVLWGVHKDQRRAQITASRVGFVLGGLLIGFGLLGFLTGTGYGDLWTAVIGWFVIDASRSEEAAARVSRALDGHTARDLMGTRPPLVAEWTTVAAFREMAGGFMPSAVVLTGFDDMPSALLQTGALRGVVPPADATVRLRDFGIPLARVHVAPPDMPARDALEDGVPVAVVEGDEILGIIGIDEVRRAAGNDAIRLGA